MLGNTAHTAKGELVLPGWANPWKRFWRVLVRQGADTELEITTSDPLGSGEGPEAEGGGQLMLEIIRQEIQREDDWKASIESRGQSVVTTSGALITLQLAIAAFSINRKTFHLPHSAKVALIVGAVLFFIAAACAIWANRPRGVQELKPESLQKAIQKWETPTEVIEQRAARAFLTVLAAARLANKKRSSWLFFAIGAQVLAVLAVGVGVCLALTL
jgi:hypothetical protein